jgi:prophage antirepressor-like protein
MTGFKNKGFIGNAVGPVGGSAEPILALLRGHEEWLVNRDIVKALGFMDKRGNHSLAGHWGNIDAILGDETKMIEPGGRIRQGKLLRAYSKKGVILVTLRARTPNAAAFRDWLAERALELTL